MRRLLFLAAILAGILAALGIAAPAGAQDALRIAAIVNDDAISQFDLLARMRMAMISSNLEDTPDVRRRLQAQVLRSLIDDRLKMQEAASQGVKVSDREVKARIEGLAQSNGMSVEDFEVVLGKSGIPIAALRDQIKVDIAWVKLAQRKLRPLVNITDAEIDAELARIAANQGKPESLVAEIFLPVTGPDQDAQVHQDGERLIQQIRAGAPFAAIARQFSGAATAAGGGVIGWVRPGQLDEALDKTAQQLAPGEVSGLIKVIGGYQILTVVDRRITGQVQPEDGRVTLAQLLVPLPGADPTAQEVADTEYKVRNAAQNAASCEDLTAAAGAANSAGPPMLKDVSIGQLPDGLRRLIINLPIGRLSEPIRLGRVIGVFIVCDRQQGAGGAPTRLDIADQLAAERLDLLARGYLRDLRRQAYIEIRN